MTTIDTTASSTQSSTSSVFQKNKAGYRAFQRMMENREPDLQAFAEKKEIDFRPLGPDTRSESIRDIFTGAELNYEIVKGESIEAKTLRAREAAEKLVSSTLVEPILKQARETNNTPPPFGPGKAEKQFGAFLDSKLSDQIVSAAQFPLVKRIQQDLLQHSGYLSDATKAASGRSTPVDNVPHMDLLG